MNVGWRKEEGRRGRERGGGWGGGRGLHADNEAFCAHFTSKQTRPCI